MNTYNLNLSSTSTSTIYRSNTLSLNDHTELILNLGGVTESIVPIYAKIDWGDGEKPVVYDNDIYRLSQDTNNLFKFSPLLNNLYKHEYYPSTYALYKNLSAQVLINYSNGDKSWFIIPIEIRTYDHIESMGDINLINSNILPLSNNPIEYQLKALKNNQIIELRGD